MERTDWLDATSDVDYDTPAVLPDDDMAARERVDWHIRQVARYDQRLNELEATFEAEIARLRARLDMLAGPLRRAVAWHEAPIRSWHEALMTQDASRKTVHMPHGSSKMRTPTRPRIFLDDEAAVTDWAREHHPELLRGPNVTALRDALDIASTEDGYRAVDPKTGEFVPGLSAQVPMPTWSLDLHPGDEF
jgi:thioester reductase-like protein